MKVLLSVVVGFLFIGLFASAVVFFPWLLGAVAELLGVPLQMQGDPAERWALGVGLTLLALVCYGVGEGVLSVRK